MDLEPNLPLADVVSQDIGRVILNLVNNAFQACAERNLSATREKEVKRKQVERKLKIYLLLFPQFPYSPNVTVITKHKDDKIEIIVSDNGSGIPDSIKEKIFQPFFTTKPTGQGTGLGLSLAYDIIKAHNGDLRCESKLETYFIHNIYPCRVNDIIFNSFLLYPAKVFKRFPKINKICDDYKNFFYKSIQL